MKHDWVDDWAPIIVVMLWPAILTFGALIHWMVQL